MHTEIGCENHLTYHYIGKFCAQLNVMCASLQADPQFVKATQLLPHPLALLHLARGVPF